MTFRHALTLPLLACALGACGGNNGEPLPSSSSAAPSSEPSSSSSSSASLSSSSSSENVVISDALIKINQQGFAPSAPKQAVVPEVPANEFYVIDTDTGSVAYSGNLTAASEWSPAGERVKLASFDALTAEGTYRVEVPGLNPSHAFTVEADALGDVHDAALKAYYFNRASTALEETYAGPWARAAGHPDTQVRIHPSAATDQRPAESTLAAPKGWYDAGDYGKYIVNSGISTYTLLAALEHFPGFYAERNGNIPESNDNAPDILNEIMWNLEWMENMQDLDGGVYHKLTTKNFSGKIMPSEGTAPRYVVQKTTSATLNFAAVMAAASRVLGAYENSFPGKAASYRAAAIDAWNWANQAGNGAIYYEQPSDVVTGAYGDNDVSDEFSWAAAELFVLTGDNQYLQAHQSYEPEATQPGWMTVSALGLISLAEHGREQMSAADYNAVVDAIMVEANRLRASQQNSAYGITTNTSRGFYWGSNGAILNQGFVLVQAYKLTDERSYLTAASSTVDYVLGKNATDYSFVTGYGARSPMHIHHRQSEADGVAEPIPGFVAGGPHSGQQDDCTNYPSNLAAKSYVDHWCSYSTNEVTINWNAPLVYMTAALLNYY